MTIGRYIFKNVTTLRSSPGLFAYAKQTHKTILNSFLLFFQRFFVEKWPKSSLILFYHEIFDIKSG